DGIGDWSVTGVQTCALPISSLAGPDAESGAAVLQQSAAGDAAAAVEQHQGTRHRQSDALTAAAQYANHGRTGGRRLRGRDLVGRSEERRVGKEGRCRRWG